MKSFFLLHKIFSVETNLFLIVGCRRWWV